MKDYIGFTIMELLCFITFKLTNDLIFGIFGLIFCILTLIVILIPKKIETEFGYYGTNLTDLKLKGKKIKIDNELKKAFKEYKEKEDIFYSLLKKND